MEELASRIRAWNESNIAVPHRRLFMTVNDVARHFKVHSNTIYHWIQDGSIFPHAEKRYDGWRIPYSDIQELKVAGRVRQRKPEEIRPPQIVDPTDVSYSLRLENALISSCIYFLLDPSGCVLYVGQSTRVLSRVSIHLRKIPGLSSVSIQPCPRDRLDEREEHFILKYRPPYNSTTIGGQKLEGDGTEYLSPQL